MCRCEIVGQGWGNCSSRGEEQAGSFCYNATMLQRTSREPTTKVLLLQCTFLHQLQSTQGLSVLIFCSTVIESVLRQPCTFSPVCYHGLHNAHQYCGIMWCSAMLCCVHLLIYIGGAPADSLVRGRGKGAWDNTLYGNFDKYIFYLDKYCLQSKHLKGCSGPV